MKPNFYGLLDGSAGRSVCCAWGTDNPRLFLIPQNGSEEQLLRVVLLPLHMHAMVHTHTEGGEIERGGLKIH